MKGLLRRLNSLLLLICILGLNLHVAAQVSVVPASDVRFNPEVFLEARVVGIPASEFGRLGMIVPESSTEEDSPLGFAVVLPEGEAQALLMHPRTTSVHSLKLQGAPGTPLRFRVDTRVPAIANTAAENPPYFEVGMTFEVTPRVFPGRKVALSSSSVVQIRRGPVPQGGLAPMVFETQAIKHDIQIPEGKTIVLGGFLTASNSAGLPTVPMVSGNPLLGYVTSKSPRSGDQPEMIVLLTPRVAGTVDAVEPAPNPSIALPPVEPVTKNEVPVVPPTPNPVPKLEVPPASSTANPPAIPAPPAPISTVTVIPPASRVEAPFYTVQAGAFGSSDNAEALAAKLKKKFDGVFIDHASAGPTPYRVRVGRLSTLAAAKRIQSQLTADGFESFVVTPDLP